MKRTYKKFNKDKVIKKKFKINNEITASQVRLINEEQEDLGVLPLAKAMNLAWQAELDLVEVSPNAAPPVVKIMDFGRYQYHQEKQQRKQKTVLKKVDTKGIRLSSRIGKHDLDVRLAQAKKFLEKGNKLKIELMLKGREAQHIDLAKKIINDFIGELGEDIVLEQPLNKLGNNLNVLVAKKGSNLN